MHVIVIFCDDYDYIGPGLVRALRVRQAGNTLKEAGRIWRFFHSYMYSEETFFKTLCSSLTRNLKKLPLKRP